MIIVYVMWHQFIKNVMNYQIILHRSLNSSKVVSALFHFDWTRFEPVTLRKMAMFNCQSIKMNLQSSNLSVYNILFLTTFKKLIQSIHCLLKNTNFRNCKMIALCISICNIFYIFIILLSLTKSGHM